MIKTEIRCPVCNKKAAETPKKDSIVEVNCSRCAVDFVFNDNKYTFSKPIDENQRRKHERFMMKRNMQQAAYQTKNNLNRK